MRTGRPAIRALILYPLNALVEDQLARLRDGLDGAGARAWLQAHRAGNRIYFGRYTGRTPVSGSRTSAATGRLRAELADAHRDAQLVAGTPAARFFANMDGGEMWSRWDMQDHPPDILITNYSMLNIMLMRSVEASIFDQTRQWLQQDPLAHLPSRRRRAAHVSRELRAPRSRISSACSSIASVSRQTPNQLRIIASSASVASGADGPSVPRVVLRPRSEPVSNRRRRDAAAQPRCVRPSARERGGAAATAKRSCEHRPLLTRCTATAFQNASGAPAAPAGASPELTLDSALAHVMAADALRLACASGPANAPQLEPRFPEQIASAMFPGLPLPRRRRGGGRPPRRLVRGAWRERHGPAPCSSAHHLPQPAGPLGVHEPGMHAGSRLATVTPPAGALHYVPTLTCGCGSRVLELLYCEACGDIFFGGYRRDTGLNPNEWYLSPDHPDLEASPDMASMDRDYLRYAVYWPGAPGVAPASPQWTQDGVPRAWRAARFTPADGKVALGGPGYLYYVPAMHSPTPPPGDSARQAYPARCPRCDADWSRRQIGSPVRTLRTGFQKIAQVLSDALLRNIAPATASQSRKLVVFSDSRQDAAKLSAGMRFSHYRDALRQAITGAIAVQGAGAQAFASQVGGQPVSPHSNRRSPPHSAARIQPRQPRSRWPRTRRRRSCRRLRIQVSRARRRRNRSWLGLPRGRSTLGSSRLTRQRSCCTNGMNPGGFTQDVLWTAPRTKEGSWRDLYTWGAPGTIPQIASGRAT